MSIGKWFLLKKLLCDNELAYGNANFLFYESGVLRSKKKSLIFRAHALLAKVFFFFFR